MKDIPIRHITPAPTEPKISKVFRVRDLAAIVGGKEVVHPLHRHDFFFVLAVANGRGEHVIDFIPYKVEGQCVFIMRPGQVHTLTLKAGTTGYLMEFDMEFYRVNERGPKNLLRRATTTNLCEVPRPAFNRLYAILENIFQEYTEQRDDYDEVIRAQLDVFFIEFVRNRRTSEKASPKSSYEQERLEEFLQLVEANVASKKQVSEYADMLNVSPYQLSSITKTILGKTPLDLINEFVILESKRYLLATSEQVNQIAWRLGYEDPSYFIRFFKKHTGSSPDAFRLNFK